MGYWTEETVAKLRELHAARLSASQIAAEMPPTRLGDAPTRNTIIGKLQRLKLFYNGPVEAKNKVRTREGAIAPVNPTKRKLSKPISHVERKEVAPAPRWMFEEAVPAPNMPAGVPRGSEAILGLRNGLCCFPIGDPHGDDFRYCCAPSGVKTYCAHHMAVAYVPTKPRKPARKPIDMRPLRMTSANSRKGGAVFDRAASQQASPLLDAPYFGLNRDRGRVYDGV